MKNASNEEIIIVGGGLMGMSLAYWIEQLTDLPITLYEQKKVGFGASGRNAGFVTCGSAYHLLHLIEKCGEQKAHEIWTFCMENIALKLEVAKKLKVKVRPDGSTTFGDESNIQAAFEFLQKHQIRSKLVENDRFGSGVKFTFEASFNSMDLLEKIKQNLRRTKFVFKKFKLEENQNKNIFLATNFLDDFEVPFKDEVRPVRAQIQRNHFIDQVELPLGNTYLPKSRIYFREDQKGILIGGLRVLDPQNEETSKLEENDIIQNSLSDFCIKNFGKMTSSERWCGIMSFSKNEHPIYREHRNISFIGGFSGHGNGFAFLSAKNWVESKLLAKKTSIFPSIN